MTTTIIASILILTAVGVALTIAILIDHHELH